jgi:hypothetical protein
VALAGGVADIANAVAAFQQLISALLGNVSGATTGDLINMLTQGTYLDGDTSAALEKVVNLHTVGDISALVATVGATNARLPNGSVMTKGIEEALKRAKLGTDTAGEDLAAVKVTAKGSSSRLTAIEALVQQANALGSIDPSTGKPRFDGAKLAELRAYMSSVSAMQNEELVKLSAKEMGDRATDNLKAAAATSAKLESNLKNAAQR